MAKAKKKLTDKQAKFCLEYLVDLNATQASIRAGYSKKTANVIGPENLAKPCIAERVAYLKAQVAEDTGLTIKKVISDIIDTHNRAKTDDDYSNELRASDMMAKIAGAYEKDNEQGGLTVVIKN